MTWEELIHNAKIYDFEVNSDYNCLVRKDEDYTYVIWKSGNIQISDRNTTDIKFSNKSYGEMLGLLQFIDHKKDSWKAERA